VPLDEDFPLEPWASKRGTPKKSLFYSSSTVRAVADRHRLNCWVS